MTEDSVTYNGAPWPTTPTAKRSWMEAPQWDKSFVPFGDRIDFLSKEGQHCATGKLRILPPRGDKTRER